MKRLISLPLHIQIFIALVLGTLIGLLANPGKHTLPDGTVKISSDFHKGREIQINEVIDANDPNVKTDDNSEIKIKKFFSTTIKSGYDFKRRYPFWTEKYNDADDKLWTSEVTNRSIRFTTLPDKLQLNYTRQYDGKPILNQYTFKSADEVQDLFPEFYSFAASHQNSLSSYVTSISKYIGDIFLRLLKMITIPLIVTSLVTGVAGLGGTDKLGRMFGRTILYYLTTSVLAITTGILLVNIIRPGVGATLPGGGEGVLTQESQSMIDIFLGLINNMIPPNPIAAFANGDFLSIITFSILFGVFIVVTGGKSGEQVKNLFEALFDVVMRMTMFIIRLAPIGVLGFMVFATASQGLEIFATLAWYMLTVALALLIHATLVLPMLLFFFAKRNPLEYARSLSPALMTAFSTASSNGTLPLTMTCVEERAGVSNKTSSFVLPLGATINMDGTALYEAVAVLFVAQASVGFSLGLETQIVIAFTALLASIGAAGIPHAGLVMMAIVLQAVGLPLEAQGIIIAVDRVLDMCRTTVNVWSDACGCAIIEKLTSIGNSSEAASSEDS